MIVVASWISLSSLLLDCFGSITTNGDINHRRIVLPLICPGCLALSVAVITVISSVCVHVAIANLNFTPFCSGNLFGFVILSTKNHFCLSVFFHLYSHSSLCIYVVYFYASTSTPAVLPCCCHAVLTWEYCIRWLSFSLWFDCLYTCICLLLLQLCYLAVAVLFSFESIPNIVFSFLCNLTVFLYICLHPILL